MNTGSPCAVGRLSGPRTPLPGVGTAAEVAALGFGRARGTADVLTTLRRTQGLPWINTIAA
ncbi:hypothetical protein ABZ672_47480, partial [Streptomyces mirabilis]|uniref:hypothetical protein n=1 Tax=Streptomyces mirabilis TaxID=68239 RepID=UPI0033D6F3ED